MKYARKTVLVDINSPKHIEPSKKTENSLTNAINSLTNATEFSRAYFGGNATSVSQLNKELNELLDRKDLDPDKKLKLYHQNLGRYLFLQRESEQPVRLNPPIPSRSSSGRTSPANTEHSYWESESEWSQHPVQPRPRIQATPQPLSVKPLITPEYATPPHSSFGKAILKSKIPKYKSNLPRSSPKATYLRQNRVAKRRDGFFVGWKNK